MSQQEGSTHAGGRLDDWLAVIEHHRVQYLILNKERDGNLLRLVCGRPGWSVDFEDGTSVLFSRGLAGAS